MPAETRKYQRTLAHTHTEIMIGEERGGEGGVHVLEEGEEVEGIKKIFPGLSTKDNVSAQVQTCR